MRKVVSLFTAAAVAATPIAALAEIPRDLSDLIGIRASSLDDSMGGRGYTYVKSDGLTQYWWNSSSKACVWAVTDNGIISSIQSSSASDCGHSDGGGSALAGVAVGAAAVGLIAALSHHHGDRQDRNTSDYNTEYERGYNDAFHGGHYARNDSEAYHSGYMAGEAEQNNRRHANSTLVRGAPAAAQNACKARGDEEFRVPSGSTVPVNVVDYGQGNYEVTVASGHRRGNCSVDRNGNISDFLRQ